MNAFRAFLVVIFTSVVAYTAVVVANHGLDLFPIFFGDIAKMEWPGQFNVDFLGFLTLSGFWLAWRHQFSPLGIILGLLVYIGGCPFVTAYLFVASLDAKGDAKALLLGKARAGG